MPQWEAYQEDVISGEAPELLEPFTGSDLELTGKDSEAPYEAPCSPLSHTDTGTKHDNDTEWLDRAAGPQEMEKEIDKMWHPPSSASFTVLGAPVYHQSINSSACLALALLTTATVSLVYDLAAQAHEITVDNLRDKPRFHRSELPPPPRRYCNVARHPFEKEFRQAMEVEFDKLVDQGTFKIVPISEATSQQQLPLPLMWVYTYKYAIGDFLERFKARLVVRGDMARGMWTRSEVYAATLAARSLRLILAIIAYFDLDTIQLDAVNAFGNPDLPEPIYTRFPPGKDRPGFCIRLLKALYGLPQAPKLWQAHLSKVLVSLGMSLVPEEPCIAITDSLIIFFYVDDIVIAFRKDDRPKAEKLVKDLQAIIELKVIGEVQWFLRMRITRDRKRHQLSLDQSNYIDAVAERFGVTINTTKYSTPRATGDMKPRAETDGEATQSEITSCQEKVGCLSYLAMMTRPDLAETVSKLSQYLNNPSQEHQSAIFRAIAYAYQTKDYALQFGAKNDPILDTCAAFTDASFGNTPDRKSFQGYIFYVLGSPVLWRAGKQPTVATSTTEAELIALSTGTKELIALERLALQIHLKIPHNSLHTVRCDNTQTVGIVTKEGMQIPTRLRHVDIQQHWLREAHKLGKIKAVWVPTEDMVADGLTKALVPDKHFLFVKNLQLIPHSHEDHSEPASKS